MNTSAINILVFRSCVKVILQLHVQTFKHVLSYFGILLLGIFLPSRRIVGDYCFLSFDIIYHQLL